MTRLRLLVPYLALTGCSTAAMMGPKDQTEPLAHVHDKDGVCAHHSITGSAGYIKACLRQDEAGSTTFFTELSTDDGSPLLDLAKWQVLVTRADGTVVFDSALEETYRSRVVCISGVCFQTTRAAHRLGDPWQAGRHDLRFTSLVDGETRAMSVTLK